MCIRDSLSTRSIITASALHHGKSTTRVYYKVLHVYITRFFCTRMVHPRFCSSISSKWLSGGELLMKKIYPSSRRNEPGAGYGRWWKLPHILLMGVTMYFRAQFEPVLSARFTLLTCWAKKSKVLPCRPDGYFQFSCDITVFLLHEPSCDVSANTWSSRELPPVWQ